MNRSVSTSVYYYRLQLSNPDNIKDNAHTISISPYYSNNRYYSSEYDTLNECLQAIQSSTTTYSFGSGYASYSADTPYDVPYANLPILDTYDKTKEYLTTQKISSNETIEVIS